MMWLVLILIMFLSFFVYSKVRLSLRAAKDRQALKVLQEKREYWTSG